MEHYIYLLSEEQAGRIKDLELQPLFSLQDGFIDSQEKKHFEITYIADFKYRIGDVLHVIDVKGFKTEVYNIKKKLFLYLYKDTDVIFEEI